MSMAGKKRWNSDKVEMTPLGGNAASVDDI